MLAHSLWGATSGLNYVILNVTQPSGSLIWPLPKLGQFQSDAIWLCFLSLSLIWQITPACFTNASEQIYTTHLLALQFIWTNPTHFLCHKIVGQSRLCWDNVQTSGSVIFHYKLQLHTHTHTVNENAVHYSLLSLVVNVADTNTFQIASPVFHSVNYHLVFLFNVNALIACAM